MSIVTEAETTVKLCSSTIKMLRDPTSILYGRNLYKDIVTFNPMFKLIICSNEKLEWSGGKVDGGVERSLSGIAWPFKFVKKPLVPSNERPIRVDLKTEDVASKMAEELFFVLMYVDRAFCRGMEDCRIQPIPSAISEATLQMTHSTSGSVVQNFMNQMTEVTTDVSLASTDAQIMKVFVCEMRDVMTQTAAKRQFESSFVTVGNGGRHLCRAKTDGRGQCRMLK